MTVSAGVENRKTRLAIRVALQELAKLTHKNVAADELRRAKDYFIGQFLMGLEDTLDHLLWVGEKVLYGEGIPDRTEITRSIEKVTAEDIRKVAREIFRTERINLSLIGPHKKSDQERIKREAEI